MKEREREKEREKGTEIQRQRKREVGRGGDRERNVDKQREGERERVRKSWEREIQVKRERDPQIWLTYFTSRYAAKYEEDVVQWNGTEEIKEEPGSNVMLGNQLRVDDHLKKKNHKKNLSHFWKKINKYSQSCVQRPPLGSQICGHC